MEIAHTLSTQCVVCNLDQFSLKTKDSASSTLCKLGRGKVRRQGD